MTKAYALSIGKGKSELLNLIQIKMKKLFLCAVMLLLAVGVNAQIMRAEELEKYAKRRYGANGLMQRRILLVSCN